jgi:2'-5' RNA ligase
MCGVATEVGRYRAGLTALVVTVPEAEPVVGRWRERLDPSASVGVPAHVTVLSPFLQEPRIDASVLRALTDMFGSYDAFDVRFEGCRRFGDERVLYLEPTPADQFRILTEAIADRWPEAPPYAGQFDDITPHLTIGQGGDTVDFDAIEARIMPMLPIVTQVASVALMVFDGSEWRERTVFPLR